MTYAELQEGGRRMSADERRANIASLTADPRFAAVVALIDSDREQFIAACADQKMAPHHGSLAHCAGSVFGLEVLAGQIREIEKTRRERRSLR